MNVYAAGRQEDAGLLRANNLFCNNLYMYFMFCIISYDLSNMVVVCKQFCFMFTCICVKDINIRRIGLKTLIEELNKGKKPDSNSKG